MSRIAEEAWHWLRRELDAWSERGITAEFWWRDDDAVDASPALAQLCRLGQRLQIPLALAVIPARLQPGLADFVAAQPQVAVLQHGYDHENHAAPGARKLELGGRLEAERIERRLGSGMDTLQSHFPGHFLPVLVPPWNRIDSRIVARLPGIGFSGLSTTRARRKAFPADGLLAVNTHLDPVHWQRQRGFIGVYPAVAILIQHLRAKRLDYRDRREPTGLLTHHLAHNVAVWRFVEDLLCFLSEHPAAAWLDARSIWRPTSQPANERTE